jgi:hypothetical protein
MKKIFTIIALVICSFGINAQVTNIYVTNKSHSIRYPYHINKECDKITRIINEYNLNDISISEFRNLIYCEHCVTKYKHDSIYNYVRYKIDDKTTNYVYKSGYYQSKSATYRGISLGLGAASIITAIIGAQKSDDNLCIVSGVLGVGVLISEIVSINYQFKSGNSLNVAAGKIIYNF